MTLRRASIAALVLFASLSFGSGAFADGSDGPGAQAFVESQHARMSGLLHQPESAARDGQITQMLNTMVDYDELTRRAFGQPCPVAEQGCTNHWAELNDAQKAEVTALLKSLVEKNYRRNLIKTLDYEVTFKGAREQGADSRIRTEAKSKVKPRDPSVQVDYVVHGAGGSFRVVDIVTEGSSLTKNYYDQFHRMITNPTQGYAHIVQKLREKLAKPE